MNVDIIGVPVDLGANRRGVDMGPSAIRYAELFKALKSINIECRDLGNINVPVPENLIDAADSKMKHLKEINTVNEELAGIVERSVLAGNIPLVLGGDHSIAVGSILGTQYALKEIGVIWMDAHGDFNTGETTLSGNLHGMSLGASTGEGSKEMTEFIKAGISYVNPKKVALIGVRDLDYEEAELLRKSGVNVYSMEAVDRLGIKEVMTRALEIVTDGTAGFHLSFDVDVISPYEAPGVGTPVVGGLTYREAHLAVEIIADSKKLRSLEFVEVNPILDYANQTGKLAVSLICSALGKRIYGYDY